MKEISGGMVTVLEVLRGRIKEGQMVIETAHPSKKV